jgi:RNA recognition motif-containing protein
MAKLYVGNLPFRSTEDEVRELFAQYGSVESVRLIQDKRTGRPRGFGFVNFEGDDEGKEAIEALDGQDFGGRKLKVSEAHERT